ncbi:prostaglandin E synthase 3-like [Piliocolobus tephrosceles]|uniref:prostaglandin E synthase 3-like n=1 Tax=Piliocolobus tephrosceles TaxID=591936 RepID=UPI000C2B0222|nr:prostaglandin E synthase 3-like [Piliocolobus tephrosceles]
MEERDFEMKIGSKEPLFPRGAFWGPRSSPPLPLSPEGSEKRPQTGRKRGVATGEKWTPQQQPPPERRVHPFARLPAPFTVQPASAKWYHRRDYVFIEFCVEDSKDVNVNFEKSKLTFRCLGGSDNFKHLNGIDLFHYIDPNDSELSVDFNNWEDWEDDSDEDMSSFDRFSEIMNNVGGDEDVDLPEVGRADDDSQDSDDEKMPDLE